jgi:small GTP-binding protein
MEFKKTHDKFNIMIIGDERVGKTAILERYLNKKFLSERKQTIGIEHYDKIVTYDDKDYLYKVWDTAGQEKFRVMARNYYQKAHGMILTCAINNRSSFENLRVWINALKDNVGLDRIQLIVIANKCDLDNERCVSTEEIQQKANELGVEYYETSAKSGKGIDEAFDTIFRKVFLSVYKLEGKGFSLNGDKNNNPSDSHCC